MEIKCLIFGMSFEWRLEIENGFTQLYTHEDRSIISCRSGVVITYRVTDHVFNMNIEKFDFYKVLWNAQFSSAACF